MFKTRSVIAVGFALLTLMLAGAASAAAQRQEDSASRDDSTANIVAAWPMATTAGSMLVTVVSVRGTAATTISVPAGKGWTLANRADDGTVGVAIYYSQNAAVQTGNQTWGVSGGQPAVVHMIEYTGVATTAALDLTATNTGFGTAATVTASGTTSQAAELALVGVAIHRRPTLTMNGNDFTVVGTVTQTGGTTGATGTRVSGGAFDNLYTGSTTPNANITFSTANARSWAAALVTFKIPSKYWIGGCTGSAWATAGCWSTVSGGTANTTAPGAGDNVIFDGAGASGQTSPVMPTSATINAIDIKGTYTGTIAVGTGKTLIVNTDLSLAGGTFTAGGTLTFSTANLHVSGGTFNANGSAFAPTNLDVSGGTMTAGTGNLTIGGAYTQSGGAASMAGTTTITDPCTITGGTLTKSGTTKTLTFSGALGIAGGTLAHSQGTLTLSSTLALSGTGALTVAATMSTVGAATMTGNSTLTGSSGGAITFADFDMTGGTVTTGSAGVTINNNVAISAGTFNNTGTSATVIDSTSTLTLSGTGAVNVTGGTFRVTRAVSIAGTSSFTSGGGATTFDTTLDLNAGTVAVNAGTLTVTGAVTVDGGAFSTAGTTDLNSTLGVSAGTFTATAGTVDVAGAVTIVGGAYSGRGTFATTLGVSSGSITPNGGTIAVTGAVTVNGGTYDGTGTSTFSSTLAVSSGTFDADGGTVNVAGQVTISGTGSYKATGAGTSNFNRNASPALSVTGGTIDANGGTINVPNNTVTISGGTFTTTTGSASFGSTVTVSGGTYDAAGGSSTATGLVTVSSGTYKIGTGATGQTMSNGMTISGTGTLDGSSTTGVLKIAATKTLTVSAGTLQTSTGSTSGPTFDVSGAGTYFFTISGGTVSLNGGKMMGVSNVAGVSIAAAATISRLDNVDFANVPATNPGSTQYLLSITQASLSLRSTGCKFDYNGATLSNLKTIRLVDSNTTVDVRAWFELKSVATNGAAAGDLYDADDDSSPDDGVGDVNNKTVVHWNYVDASDTAGAIQGLPTAAFDWNTGAYYSTYATFRDVTGANTVDRIYVRDADGEPVSSYDIANTNGNIVGTPLWTTESNVHILYVATSTGRIYRLIDTNGTLAMTGSGAWSTVFTNAGVASITSPLSDDGTNLYFGGTASANNYRVFGVSKSAKTLVKTVTTLASITASPSWKKNTATSTTYLFVGSTVNGAGTQSYLYRINMVPTGAVDATCCGTTGAGATTTSIGSSVRLVNSILYAGDGNSKMHALDAMNTAVGGFINKSGWPYQDSLATRHATVTVGAIQGAPWVDTTIGRLFYGDNDGHLYQLTTAGALATNYPIKLTTANQLRTSPVYLSGSGVVVIGDSGGNVYYVDVKNGSGSPAVFYTYPLTGAVSSISYNSNTKQFMVGTASGALEMLPVKTDPTPTAVF